MTHGQIERLQHDMRPDIMARLLPFTATPNNPRCYDKEALWAAIGGVKGLLQIRRSAGVIALIARDISERQPAARDAAEEIFATAVCLRFASLLCIVEAWACSLAKPIPRILAWTIAQHYVDMACSLEAIESIG